VPSWWRYGHEAGPSSQRGAHAPLAIVPAVAAVNQIRLLVIEDVPQVAQYIRGLLNSQATIKLLDVLTDGAKTLPAIAELRPDVVIVDALLQGRLKGMTLVEQIASSDYRVPVIVLTVSQREEDIVRSYDLGVNTYIQKPVEFDNFMRVVNAVHEYWILIATLPPS